MHVFHVCMWRTHVYHWWLRHISHIIAQCNNTYGAWQDAGIRLCTNIVKAIDEAAEVSEAQGSMWERVKHVYLHWELTQTDSSTPLRWAKFTCVWCLFIVCCRLPSLSVVKLSSLTQRRGEAANISIKLLSHRSIIHGCITRVAFTFTCKYSQTYSHVGFEKKTWELGIQRWP